MSDRLLGFHEESKHRTAQEEKPTRLLSGNSTYCPSLSPQGAHPYEGKRVHHSKSKPLYPIDFMMISLL